MKSTAFVLAAILVAFMIIHAIIYVNYDRLNPCDAAVDQIVQMAVERDERPLDTALGRGMVETYRKNAKALANPMRCYAVALRLKKSPSRHWLFE